MARKRIFCIGFELPGDDFEYIDFGSDQSLLDADVVLFRPGFGQHYASESYQGQPLFSHSTSVQVANDPTLARGTRFGRERRKARRGVPQ